MQTLGEKETLIQAVETGDPNSISPASLLLQRYPDSAEEAIISGIRAMETSIREQNALRHTCISACVAINKNVPQVAYESGNSTSIIKQHYLQPMPASTAAAWFSITPVVVHRYKEEPETQQGE